MAAHFSSNSACEGMMEPMMMKAPLMPMVYDSRPQCDPSLQFPPYYTESSIPTATIRHNEHYMGSKEEDEGRVKRRRELNRLAARRCRQKRRERAEQLERDIQKLQLLNSELQRRVREFSSQKEGLRRVLSSHYSGHCYMRHT